MSRNRWNVGIAALASVGIVIPLTGSCGPQPAEEAGAEAAAIEAPESIRREHEEIHEALVAATRAPGPVGESARELEAVLGPHFEREEQIALPPLGLLEPLARGDYEPWMRDVLPMTDSLAAELPQMLREHEAIGAATARLERVAREEGAADVERLARTLRSHAKSEEEILYPAAILVGDVVRQRAR